MRRVIEFFFKAFLSRAVVSLVIELGFSISRTTDTDPKLAKEARKMMEIIVRSIEKAAVTNNGLLTKKKIGNVTHGMIFQNK